MNLPACYDPVYQEERRQLRWDRWQAELPECDGCGGRIQPGEPFYPLQTLQGMLTICGSCLEGMAEEICFPEDPRTLAEEGTG